MSSTKPNYFNHKLEHATYSCMACGLFEDFFGYVKSCPAGEFAWKDQEAERKRREKAAESRKGKK